MIEDENPKSFAAEMSKNKQKFMLMQKSQITTPSDVYHTRGRAIPKGNPSLVSKKLFLLKKNTETPDGRADDTKETIVQTHS